MQTVVARVRIHQFCHESIRARSGKAHQYGVFVGYLLRETALQELIYLLVVAQFDLLAHHRRGDGAVVSHMGGDGVGCAGYVVQIQACRGVAGVLQPIQYVAGQDVPSGTRADRL